MINKFRQVNNHIEVVEEKWNPIYLENLDSEITHIEQQIAELQSILDEKRLLRTELTTTYKTLEAQVYNIK